MRPSNNIRLIVILENLFTATVAAVLANACIFLTKLSPRSDIRNLFVVFDAVTVIIVFAVVVAMTILISINFNRSMFKESARRSLKEF